MRPASDNVAEKRYIYQRLTLNQNFMNRDTGEASQSRLIDDEQTVDMGATESLGAEVKEVMPEEIERKFLVKELPENWQGYPHIAIEQGYLVADPKGLEVRLRSEGFGEKTLYYETVKVGKGRKRLQPEIEVSARHFQTFWPITEGKRIEKNRYLLPRNEGGKIELDIYRGQLEGLQVVEVEFANDEASEKFVPPAWFGEEVTDNDAYKNMNLAVNGLPKDLKSESTSAQEVSERLEIPRYDLDRGVGVVVDMIKDKLVGRDKPLIVSIAGGSASGKTSAVANTIAQVFGEKAMILSMDDYYGGNSHMKKKAEEGVILNWDHPEALELDLLHRHLTAFRKGKPIYKPKYSFKTGDREGYEPISPKSVVIVEGLFALGDKVKDEADLKVFVDIGRHGRIMRRLLRDVVRTSMSPRDILKYFAEVVEPMHEQHVQSTRENADLIITNEYNPHIEAARSGLYEKQLKFRLSPSQDFPVHDAGAKYLGSTEQRDYYYHPLDRDLTLTDEALRIREDGELIILTYKGPHRDAAFRERPKFECHLDAETRDKFLAMYGSRVKVINKKRILYQLDEAVLAVDRVTKLENDQEINLGRFLEIRGEIVADQQVDLEKVMGKLGLTMQDSIKTSYAAM